MVWNYQHGIATATHSAIKSSTPKTIEADFRKVATPGEREMRSTVDIQRASSVTVNKYVCAYIYIGMCVCVYIYMDGGEKEGWDKTIWQNEWWL